MSTMSTIARGGARLSALLLVSAVVLLAVLTYAVGQSSDTRLSPDGVWRVHDEVALPERFPAPTAYSALTLDAALLESLLANAPRETFGSIPPRTQIWLPRPTGGFVQIAVARSQQMEPALAASFPKIKHYVFEDQHQGFTGHISIGTRGVWIAAQTEGGLLRLDPVETASGRVYLSYLDKNRTDGGNDFHDVDEHDHHEEPPTVPNFVALAPQLLPQVQAGDQLRIYRLAASTTGEFFQSNDFGNGIDDVMSRLDADLGVANTVFESEVSVRLMLADVSDLVIYDDPANDPFDNSTRQCKVSLNACNTDADCDVPNGETCDLVKTACALREDNRDNMKAVLDDDDYDLGFLFAAKTGNGANGCAWFVVCQSSSDTLHKARGAGLMGGNGTVGAGGLLAHEVGHQLGARHTFTGQAGSCSLNEFQAGASESGYEPGSGTTRMSYRGICDSDNVDTSLDAAGANAYFHSRSFDEIVDNVFNGTGATCGTLVATGNTAPAPDAGLDYTIPRQTPFMLTGTASDAEESLTELTFNWEQYDRAETQRPIDSANLADGPIVRSVPPGPDPSRTIPRLQDLLDGVQRKGEILSQVDRDMNFRMIARDNRMGGGGVAYDSMVVHVSGDPFFITNPNSGSLQAACQAPLTWQVGGGAVAPQVSALFSSDGGLNFNTTLIAATPNDGSTLFTVPCTTGANARIKLQSVDNIFFDINDQDLTVFNSAPSVAVNTASGVVDNACEFTVQFNASASDSCGLPAANVGVELIKAANNFTLGAPVINTQQVSSTQVDVSGSVLVSALLNSPAQLTVKVTATDACGLATSASDVALINDETPPQIDVALDPNLLWPPNHKMVPIQATVVASDNCPGVSFELTALVSDEPDNGTGDGDTVNDIQGAMFHTPDLDFSLRSERVGSGDGRVYTATYTAQDGSQNETSDAATVSVPKSQSNK
ncbi:reprolysin-like metallopeptidase [Lysobacter cavernae]|uniref:Reprolysin-like metallopeptidase n=1 Tax=Lysobacter cavernae TaxID=1685901 RepID=A0ABV7RN28_9GAMM